MPSKSSTSTTWLNPQGLAPQQPQQRARQRQAAQQYQLPASRVSESRRHAKSHVRESEALDKIERSIRGESMLFPFGASFSHAFCLSMGTKGENVALNKPVLASSSVLPNEYASRAVDGVASTQWSSGAGDQWIWVDLLGKYTLNHVAHALQKHLLQFSSAVSSNHG